MPDPAPQLSPLEILSAATGPTGILLGAWVGKKVATLLTLGQRIDVRLGKLWRAHRTQATEIRRLGARVARLEAKARPHDGK